MKLLFPDVYLRPLAPAQIVEPPGPPSSLSQSASMLPWYLVRVDEKGNKK